MSSSPTPTPMPMPLLDDTSRGVPGSEDGRVMLALTVEGERHAYDDWQALAEARR